MGSDLGVVGSPWTLVLSGFEPSYSACYASAADVLLVGGYHDGYGSLADHHSSDRHEPA